jgi:cytochrome c oxidase subunit 2
MSRWRALPLALAATGCAGVQSMTAGAGAGSQDFNWLMSLFLAITGLAFVLVLLFLGVALMRRDAGGRERQMAPLLIAWVWFIVVGLGVLTLVSFLGDRSQAGMAGNRSPLRVTITGNQWWWQVDYQDPVAARSLTTANELHLPVGRPVEITLHAGDVIHSLWVPALAGKQDLIPGRDNRMRLLPLKTGYVRGTCAEFCGMQHAHMALDVLVESPRRFAAWYEAQLRPAPTPSNPLARAGMTWFMTHQCATCHMIAGTDASGRVGPDLTHLMGRRSIAAGTLPMNRENLYGWIANPQAIKPGTHMPEVGPDVATLHALVAYLGTLT